MTKEQLEGAIMAIQAINVFSEAFQATPGNYLYNAGLDYRAQLAAMPPQPDLRTALVEARTAINSALTESLDRPYQAYAGDRPHCVICGGRQYHLGWLEHADDCAVGNLKVCLDRINAALEATNATAS